MISHAGLSPYGFSIIGLILCTLLMVSTWIWAHTRSFYSIVDGVWAFGIGGLALFYFSFQRAWTTPKLVALFLVLVWSGRLGVHLSRRLLAHFPVEDRRYTELRSLWKGALAQKSLLFFLFQGLSQPFFAFPFAVIALAGPGPVSPFFWFWATLSAVGILGESLADAQLRAFLSVPERRGQVCDWGLWHYSRHPNYFFEWIIWCGFGVMGAAVDSGAWSLSSLSCSLVMLLLLLFVTGVPAAEASSLRSKGPLYRTYQATTSSFVPWFKKSESFE